MKEYELVWDEYLEKQDITTGIVKDGPLNFPIWLMQDIKILFYYKETYGYNYNEGASISSEFKRWIKDKIPTYKKMAILSYFIYESYNEKYFDDYQSFIKIYKSLFLNDKVLINALSKVAVVNIGKLSIESNNTNDSFVRDNSRRNKKLLRSQLILLKPNIIICGGRVASDSLFCDIGYLSTSNYKMNAVQYIDEKVIASYYHLSSRECNPKLMYDYYSMIIKNYIKSHLKYLRWDLI